MALMCAEILIYTRYSPNTQIGTDAKNPVLKPAKNLKSISTSFCEGVRPLFFLLIIYILWPRWEEPPSKFVDKRGIMP